MSKVYKKKLPLGVQVLEVGNLTVDSLYKLASALCPKESYTESALNEITSRMMGIVFNVRNVKDKIQMRYVNINGDTLITQLHRIKSNKLLNDEEWQTPKTISYEFLDDVAYLRIFSFEAANEKRFKKTIDRFFRKAENSYVSSIVIDIRENRGGFILLLEHLLSYINTSGKLLILLTHTREVI